MDEDWQSAAKSVWPCAAIFASIGQPSLLQSSCQLPNPTEGDQICGAFNCWHEPTGHRY